MTHTLINNAKYLQNDLNFRCLEGTQDQVLSVR